MIPELPKKHENGGNAMGAVEVFSDGRSLAFPILVWERISTIDSVILYQRAWAGPCVSKSVW
jgi:hypothetical protein